MTMRVFSLSVLLAVFFCPLVEAEEYQTLFPSSDLSAWHAREPMDPRTWQELADEEREAIIAKEKKNLNAGWSIQDGKLNGKASDAALTTDAEFGDVELQLGAHLAPGAAATLYVRGAPLVTLDEPGQFDVSVAFVGEQRFVEIDGRFGPVGERLMNPWNEDIPVPATGPLQWQVRQGEVALHSLRIRPLSSAEANQRLAQNEEGFRSIFNGKDLSGWKGPVENYQVTEGALMCLPGKGGTIHTTEEYADFTVRLEFQLPAGGNNGLAIRYPGEGDTAYLGMCELQVLDDTAEVYRGRLDPRQYHGSAYGMVAAHQGYLRPVGDWNYQQVTVRGARITVVLNGTQILDADLSQVTEYMGNRPHPGKDRTSGYFGLAGHSDPVRFRNLRILALDSQ